MTKVKLVKLTCLKTHGRWNKGDEASFGEKAANQMTSGQNPNWAKGKVSKPALAGNTSQNAISGAVSDPAAPQTT